uniref:B-cell receptor CD22 first Ig-like domain-containing protein n=1 Tax=Gadus morhua TaxID=8049 RepID=A0A8C5FIB2_GADMO
MKLRSSARGFLAFLLSLPALKADDWITYPSSNVCAPRGSTVHISCHYECPRNPNINLTVKDKKWFSQRDVDVKTDTDYAGRVEYKCSRPSCTSHICNANCTLSISDLRQSDSSEYKFRFKTYQVGILEYAAGLGVTLSVTDLEVKVSSPMRNNPSWVVLECHSMCGLAGNPTYIWIRNGQSAGEGMKYPGIVWSQYSYSCAVKGYEHFPSPSVCKSTPQFTDIAPG